MADSSADRYDSSFKLQVIEFVARVFSITFSLHSTYRLFMKQSGDEVLPFLRSCIPSLETYCTISKTELHYIPIFLLRNVCYFCDYRGLNALKIAFENCSTTAPLPLRVANNMCYLVYKLVEWLNLTRVSEEYFELRRAMAAYYAALSEADMKFLLNGVTLERKSIEVMWLALRISLHETKLARDVLDLAWHLFDSETCLGVRLAGLGQINCLLNHYSELEHRDGTLKRDMAAWVLEKKLLQTLFGPRMHNELVKQSGPALTLLAVTGNVTSTHLDTLWSSLLQKWCSVNVLDVLVPFVRLLSVDRVDYCLQLARHLQPHEHTEETLSAVIWLTRRLWSAFTRAANFQSRRLSADSVNSTAEDSQQHLCPLQHVEDVECSDSLEEDEELDEELAIVPQPNVGRAVRGLFLEIDDDEDDEEDEDTEEEAEVHVKQHLLLHHRRAVAAVATARLLRPTSPFGGNRGPTTSACSPAAITQPPPSPSSSNANMISLQRIMLQNLPRTVASLQVRTPHQVTLDSEEEEDSGSSRLSHHSERNLADFDDENLSDEEEELMADTGSVNLVGSIPPTSISIPNSSTVSGQIIKNNAPSGGCDSGGGTTPAQSTLARE